MKEWQTSLNRSELPTFKQLVDFIVHRCQVLEATGKSCTTSKTVNLRSQINGKRQSASRISNTNELTAAASILFTKVKIF